MKRNKARVINQNTTDLNNQAVRNNLPTFHVEVTPEHLIRLTEYGRWYNQEDIAKVAEYLFNTYGYKFQQQFEVCGGSQHVMAFFKKSDVSLNPIFIIYNEGGNHWVTFCIINFENEFVILYKDSFGAAISKDLECTIKNCFAGAQFKIHDKKEQTDGSSCGPMSLKNMEIIMRGLKDNKASFINDYTNVEFCSQRAIEEVKQYFKENLTKNHSQKLVQNILNLQQDEKYEDFKKDLKEFLDTCLELALVPSEQYRNVLQEEISKQEIDPNYVIKMEDIEKARKLLLENNQIKEIIAVAQQTSMSHGEKREGNCDFGPSITSKFPEQMQIFTEIFDLLAKSKADETLNRALQEVSKIFGIDYDKIKQFFEINRDKEEANEKQEEVVKPKDIKEIKDEISAFKSNACPDNSEKTFEELLLELQGLNMDESCKKTDEEKMSQLSEDESRTHFFEYQNSEINLKLKESCMEVEERYQEWKNKSKQDILNWARDKKTNKLQNIEFCEAMAVMDRANELVTGGDKLRRTQILSVLTFLRSKEDKGKLCQISTGEGKTIIVSLLATFKVLQGKKVDIITSNQVLAEKGMESRENFYGLFEISVANNNTDESYRRGPRACYTADIVYGNIGNFQFDYLRDSFENLETRSNRKFSCVILDEVDSMLVDNGGYIAKLAEQFPGIDSLKYVYLKIWQELYKAERELLKEVEQSLENKANELKKRIGVPDENLQCEYDEYVRELATQQVGLLKSKIKTSNPADIELIPTHLKQYAKDMVDQWIENAIFAKYQCRENEEYVIKKNKDEDIIVPVDYQNTGVTLKNTIWSNGLHQFVQLKHNLQLTSESLTSSFISNIGYIKLYNNNILGLTGTLGSIAEQNLLSTVYNVEYTRIPTYKKKNFKEIGGIVVKNSHWINWLALMSLILTCSNRSVLIICKTIKDLQDLEKNIQALKILEKLDELKIRTYPDEDSSHIVNKEIGVREIIIATNIAGRGTDFKSSSELEQMGGLHVCISFLPVNQRVEDQAFGRTSRQGNAGTAQLIIKESDVLELGIEIVPEMDFETIKKRRDEIEKLRLEKVKNEELIEITFQDRIFSKFSDLYRNFTGFGDRFVAKDLKEYWAFWLQKKNFKEINLNEVEKEFHSFEQSARNILAGKITHNPYYSILQAEHYLGNNQTKDAKESLNHAIHLSQAHAELLYSAHMKLFEVAIESGNQIRERFKKAIKEVIFIYDGEKNIAYENDAKFALEAAKKALEKEIHYLQYHFIGVKLTDLDSDESDRTALSNSEFNNILTHVDDNLLVKHIYSRFVILNVFLQQIEHLTTQINNRSERTGIAINTRISNHLGRLDPKIKNEQEVKKAITDAELSELGLIGLDTIYALREVHDVPKEVIVRAQGQIGGGMAVLASGLIFPLSMPILGPIAGTLITEGVCDIVIELMSQGSAQFSEAAYIKGKCISYGIAVATMGIGAIAKSTKVLDQAIKACKSFAGALRKCPHFTSVCKKLAIQVERLAKYLEKSKHLIEQLRKLQKLSAGDLDKLNTFLGADKVAQLQHLKNPFYALSRTQILITESAKIGKGIAQGVLGVVTSEIVTRGLGKTLQSLKPTIKEWVKSSLKKELTLEQLKLVDEKQINEILIGSYGEIAADILKEVSLGVVRNCNSWRAKIVGTAMDSVISTHQIVLCTEKFCDELKKQLAKAAGNTKQGESKISENSDAVIELIATLVAEKIFGLIIHLASKHTHLAIKYMRQKLWNSGKSSGREEELPSEEQGILNSFCKIVDAFETLGIEPGASKDEINEARNKSYRKYHNKGDSDKLYDVNGAYDLLKGLYKELPPKALPSHGHSHQFARNTVVEDAGFEEAHIGNIETLSERYMQCIVVKSSETGKVIKKFGEQFNDKDPMSLHYSHPNKGEPGHYSIPAEVIKQLKDKNIDVSQLKPTYKNNCCYDALELLFRARGSNVSALDLRKTAEESNLTNFCCVSLVKLSQVFNNKITQRIYLDAQAALLVGGYRRTQVYKTDENYSSGPIKIDVGVELKKELSNLRNELKQCLKEVEEFSKSETQSQYMRHKKSKPFFGNNPNKTDLKTEMMMGICVVQFNDGKILKYVTVSGDYRFCTRLRVNPDGEWNVKDEFLYKNKNGFVFVDPENITEKKIYDLWNREEREEKFNHSCCAQKFLYEVGEYIKKHRKENWHLKIKNFRMAEAYFANTGSDIEIEGSCPKCKITIPLATGENSPW